MVGGNPELLLETFSREGPVPSSEEVEYFCLNTLPRMLSRFPPDQRAMIRERIWQIVQSYRERHPAEENGEDEETERDFGEESVDATDHEEKTQ